MNKKLLFGMVAAATLWLNTACTSDDQEALRSDNQARVSFTLGLEGNMATRAISDGKTANELMYAVFDANGSRISTIQKVDKKNVTFPAKEEITLAKGETYKVAFWAQNSACTAYTVSDDMNVTVDYAGANNDETRDAFFKTVEFIVTGDATINVELRRPFAQINVGVVADDWAAAVASGKTITTSNVEIDMPPRCINLVTGAVSGSQTVTYTAAAIPSDDLTVGTDTYKWLSMSYILVNDASADGAGKTTLNSARFTLTPTNGTAIVLEDGLTNVPVQRNWRTNILGRLLSGKVDFNISIDNNYDGDLPEITTAADLTAALAKGGVWSVNANVGDIDLRNYNAAGTSAPLVLNINSEVGTIKIGNKSDRGTETVANPQPIEIVVAKDVPFPAIEFGSNWVNGCVDALLPQVTIKGTKGTTEACKSITWKNNFTKIAGLTFEDVLFDGCGVNFDGMTCDANNLVVKGCTFKNLISPAISFQNYGYDTAMRCTLKNVTIEDNEMSWASTVPNNINGIKLWNCEGPVVIRNNKITSPSYHGISVRNDGATEITGNTITAPQDGIKIESNSGLNEQDGMGNVTIKNNTINGEVNGIRIVPLKVNATPAITIEGNTIKAPTTTVSEDGYGILISNTKATGNPKPTFSGVLTVKNNTKSGTLTDASKWFHQESFTAATGSDINTPWNN